MQSHLLKCGIFVGLQAAIFCALFYGSQTFVEQAGTTAVHNRSLNSLAKSFLREKLYPVWAHDQEVLTRIVNDPERTPILRELVPVFQTGTDNYLAALVDKDERLRSVPGNRLIIVGGSGCAFGIDSQVLRDRYGYEPVNMGVHAGLGVNFMLNHVNAHARKGDIVLLCFERSCILYDVEASSQRRRESIRTLSPAFSEYFDESFRWAGDGTVAGAARILRNQFLRSKQFGDKEALAVAAARVRHYRDELLSKIDDDDIEERKRQEEKQRKEYEADFQEVDERLVEAFLDIKEPGIYRRSNFNEYGDFIGHRFVTEPDAAERPPIRNWKSNIISARDKERARFRIAQINAFALQCERQGIEVLFCYPPLLMAENAEAFASEYSSLVQETLKVPVLFPIEESFLERRFFYDTAEHLTWRGTCRRMEKVLTGLDAKCQPKLDVPVTQQIAARDQFVRKECSLADVHNDPERQSDRRFGPMFKKFEPVRTDLVGERPVAIYRSPYRDRAFVSHANRSEAPYTDYRNNTDHPVSLYGVGVTFSNMSESERSENRIEVQLDGKVVVERAFPPQEPGDSSPVVPPIIPLDLVIQPGQTIAIRTYVNTQKAVVFDVASYLFADRGLQPFKEQLDVGAIDVNGDGIDDVVDLDAQGSVWVSLGVDKEGRYGIQQEWLTPVGRIDKIRLATDNRSLIAGNDQGLELRLEPNIERCIFLPAYLGDDIHETAQWGDFNGDGWPDRFSVDEATMSYQVELGSVDGLGVASAWTSGYGQVHQWFPYDGNEDGRTDLLGQWQDRAGLQCMILRSSGASLDVEKQLTFPLRSPLSVIAEGKGRTYH